MNCIIIIGNENIVKATHLNNGSSVVVSPVNPDEQDMVTIYKDTLPEDIGIRTDNLNQISECLHPVFMKCDGYHAVRDFKTEEKMIVLPADIDLSEDMDERIVKVVEWARILFKNLKW